MNKPTFDKAAGKENRSEIEAREKILTRALEDFSDGLIILNKNGIVNFYNKSAETMLERSRGEVLGKRLIGEAFPETAGSEIENMIRQAYQSTSPLTLEFHFDRYPFQNWYKARFYPGEDSLSIFFTVTTERKKAEEEVRADMEQYRRIVENSNEGIWSGDTEYRTTFANDKAADMLGYTAEEMIGVKITEFMFPEDLAEHDEQIRNRRKGIKQNYVRRMKHKDGSTVWMSVSAAPIFDDDKNYLGSFAMLTDITERLEAEKALFNSERRLNDIIQGNPIPTFVIDINHKVTHWNASCEQLTGVKKAEMVGTKRQWVPFYDNPRPVIADLILDRAPESAFKSYYGKTFFKSPLMEDSYEGINYFPHFGNKGKWLHFTAAPMKDSAGNIIGAIETLQDISERKEAEHALVESEERYRKLFDTANDAIFLMRGEKFIDCNNKTMEMFRCRREQILFHSPYEFSPKKQPCGTPSVTKAMEYINAALSGKPQFFEWMHSRLDGEEFYAEVSLNALELSGKRFILALVRDINQRKLSEVKLYRSNEAYRALADNSPDIIIRFDKNLRYQYANTALETATGKPIGEFIGKNLRELDFPEAVCNIWEDNLRDVLLSGKPLISQFDLILKNERRYYDWRLNPEFNTVGEVETVLSVARDITETRRLQELESRAHRLETAGQIAGQVAHDFNNLLAPLMAYPDFIRDELPPGNRAEKFLTAIENAARQIAEINQQLLTLGRRGHYNQEPMNLNTIVREVLSQMDPSGPSLEIKTNLADDLMNIKAGGAQIHRVIANLIANARDAMMDVGKINITTENIYVDRDFGNYTRVARGEYAKLTIADSGSGIPEDNLQKIFDPFFTTKTTDKKKGSGLGLSVVDAVIKDHNGYIDIESRLGLGTSMYVYLPITREASNETAKEDIIGGSAQILVVDDDKVQREVTAELLGRLGYTVKTASGGEEAIRILKSRQYDLLILDMIMPPGIDGAETLRRTLEIYPGQKALIISGFSESERVNEALRLGAGAYIRKPLNLKAIASAVRKELDRVSQESSR